MRTARFVVSFFAVAALIARSALAQSVAGFTNIETMPREQNVPPFIGPHDIVPSPRGEAFTVSVDVTIAPWGAIYLYGTKVNGVFSLRMMPMRARLLNGTEITPSSVTPHGISDRLPNGEFRIVGTFGISGPYGNTFYPFVYDTANPGAVREMAIPNSAIEGAAFSISSGGDKIAGRGVYWRNGPNCASTPPYIFRHALVWNGDGSLHSDLGALFPSGPANSCGVAPTEKTKALDISPNGQFAAIVVTDDVNQHDRLAQIDLVTGQVVVDRELTQIGISTLKPLQHLSIANNRDTIIGVGLSGLYNLEQYFFDGQTAAPLPSKVCSPGDVDVVRGESIVSYPTCPQPVNTFTFYLFDRSNRSFVPLGLNRVFPGLTSAWGAIGGAFIRGFVNSGTTWLVKN